MCFLSACWPIYPCSERAGGSPGCGFGRGCLSLTDRIGIGRAAQPVPRPIVHLAFRGTGWPVRGGAAGQASGCLASASGYPAVVLPHTRLPLPSFGVTFSFDLEDRRFLGWSYRRGIARHAPTILAQGYDAYSQRRQCNAGTHERSDLVAHRQSPLLRHRVDQGQFAARRCNRGLRPGPSRWIGEVQPGPAIVRSDLQPQARRGGAICPGAPSGRGPGGR